MKSISKILLFLVACATITACNQVSHRKTKGGMPYQLYRGNGTEAIKPGYVLKLNYTQKIKDSVYFTTRGKLPFYLPVTDQTQPYDISELWSGLKKGDSVIATQMMDTFIKRNPANVPPQFRNGDRIITTIHVLDVFSSDSLAHADEEKGKATWLANEISYIQSWLTKNNIHAEKTASGAFVQILNPGTGNLIDSGNYVSVKYTGRSWSGKVFDSNVDTSFHHIEAMTFPVMMNSMIKGFDEAMLFLRPGAEAKIYVPSMLGYGARPQSPDIKPFEHLMFDVKVVDVKTAPPRQAAPMTPKVDATQSK